jgi:alkylation response protein AidB-like acyl-CoA dehydrogenase
VARRIRWRVQPPAQAGCGSSRSAFRDGNDWVINGAKMFTTGAHISQYVFLITNTDPDAPKHESLTMILVPVEPPDIEIQGIRTVDGDRTNIVYYSDVRVDDKYRLGEVNGGWTVLREPLNAEQRSGRCERRRPPGHFDHDASGRFHGDRVRQGRRGGRYA